MNQGTRSLIANVFLGAGSLAVVVFIVTHFMTTARPPWRDQMAWLGVASMVVSRAVRGRRRAMPGSG